MGAGRILNEALKVAGFRLVRIPKRQDPSPAIDLFNESLREVSAAPLDPKMHLAHAEICLRTGRPLLAHSSARTAIHLGGSGSEYKAMLDRALAACPPLEEMSHNGYYRLYTLANAIREFSGGKSCSVLDVGGGAGDLSRFIPDYSYCLAEPVSNGIAGEKLPFQKESFDLVVACHVLEHIPKEHRDTFLTSMLDHSRIGVILLNPFHTEGYSDTEGLQLVYDQTKASWAKEHLDCVVPRVEEVTDYAKAKGLRHVVRPNGTRLVSFSVFCMDFFASVHKEHERARKFNRYMNTRMLKHQDNPEMPAAQLIYLEKHS